MHLLFLYYTILFISTNYLSTLYIEKVIDYTYQFNDKSEQAILINMSIPSNEKRLFLIDLKTKDLIYSTYVAHGKGSGEGITAIHFSDSIDSHCTSLGLYKVGNNYQGTHGDSFELIGLEESNSNALKRNIVIHSAWYATENFIEAEGRCGNSWGCPAISSEALLFLKPYLKKNILVYIYTNARF